MATRAENEKKFKQWVDNPDGTRTYRYVVKGRRGWLAHYVKLVDADENTMSFRQYNDGNEKHPCQTAFRLP